MTETVANSSNSQERQSNFELLRIVSMFMIIGQHLAIHGVHLFNKDFYDTSILFNKIVVDFLMPGGHVGVAVFFMITGYFMINKYKISILRVLLEAIFYGVISCLVLLIAYFSKYEYLQLSALEIIQQFLKSIINPSTSYAWWFLSAYIIVVLLSPLINKLFSHLDKNGFLILLIIFFLAIYLVDRFCQSDFFSITRGLCFYLLGGFISQHVPMANDRAALRRFVYLLVFGAFWVALASFEFYYYNYFVYFNDYVALNSVLTNEAVKGTIEAILGPLCAIPLFLFFRSFSFHNKAINFLARTTFGIYLLHDSYSVRQILWRYLIGVKGIHNSRYFFAYVVACIFSVFAICCLIDLVRIALFEKRTMRFVGRVFESFKNKHYSNG